MAGEWTTFRLGDVCSKIGSGATPRGGSSVYLDQGDIALIRSQNIYNDGFHHDGITYLTEQHSAELANVEVLEHDVLLNLTGDSVARSCEVDADILPARVNQHVAIIRPESTVLWPRFLRYFLISPAMQAEMLSLAGAGATRKALTKGMIESFKVPAPTDVNEQRAIAHILGTLDDKIELNRRMNQTLEAMARALFKSWFVDFDPVRAKQALRKTEGAEGRPSTSSGQAFPGLPKSIADLFSDSFEDSELGEIPMGWEVKGIDEIANFLNGLALQKYPRGDGPTLPVIKIAQLRKGDTEGADRCNTNVPPEYVINDGDVLFSWSGSLQCVLWAGDRGALNQHLFKVTSTLFPKWFYYLWVHEHLASFRHTAAGKATTMGHIQRHHLSDAKIVVPESDVLNATDKMIAPIIEQVMQRRVESRTLAALRDTLLPKLISGDLRLRDTEQRMKEEAA